MYIYLKKLPSTGLSLLRSEWGYDKEDYPYAKRHDDYDGFLRVVVNLSAYQSRVKPETIARNVIASVIRQKGLVPLARDSRNINSFLVLNKAPSRATKS
jgi:hypothetical protein